MPPLRRQHHSQQKIVTPPQKQRPAQLLPEMLCFPFLLNRHPILMINLFGREYANSGEFATNSCKLGSADTGNLQTNVPQLSEGLMTCETSPSLSWSDFVERWHGFTSFLKTRFDYLVTKPFAKAVRTIQVLVGQNLPAETVNKTVKIDSFMGQFCHKGGQGQRGSILKNGVIVEWIAHLIYVAVKHFDHYECNTLHKFSYAEARCNMGRI